MFYYFTMDEAPPPPYSETDVFSHPGRSPAVRAGSNEDAASETSTHGTPIYTPPETPRESHFSFPVVDDHRSIASAHSYFESRPALVSRVPGQNFVASLAITEDASPHDFPYPGWANQHDTTEQDWQTFLNYLLPDHAARSNSQTIDRKLQAEDESQSSKSDRSIAEAQLGQIKSSSDLPLRPSHDIDTMVREWNDGFFGPRGVTIQRIPHSSRNVSELPAADDPPISIPQSQPSSESQPQTNSQPEPQPREQAPRSRWNPFRPFNVSNQGIRIGRLSIDDDRVSFGDSFEVDRNGVRWNGLSSNDLQFEPDTNTRSIPRGPFPDPPFGRGRGRGRGGMNPFTRSFTTPVGRPTRSRSGSPHSVSSSSSSSDSDSSIGSLPDWDDLRDSQLPITKQSISAWLAHPEQPVTKTMLRNVRTSIKAARNAPPPTDDPGWDVSKQALRQEVRSLLARLKDLKREQKKANRATRKERREQKRAGKRERRDRRRADRRESREARHAERSVRRGGFAPFGGRGRTIAPLVPEVHVPPVPSIPPIPGPHFGGGPFGGRGGFRGLDQRRWEASVRAAHREAGEAAARGVESAERARAFAESVTAHTAAQVRNARFMGQAEAAAARAQAQAAAARWGGHRDFGSGSPDASTPFVYPQQQQDEGTMWNDESKGRGMASGVSGGDGGSSKYEAANALETQIAAKTSALRGLQQSIEELRGKGSGERESKSSIEVSARNLEKEIEDLQREMQKLMLEADEELARKMAEEEGWRG